MGRRRRHEGSVRPAGWRRTPTQSSCNALFAAYAVLCYTPNADGPDEGHSEPTAVRAHRPSAFFVALVLMRPDAPGGCLTAYGAPATAPPQGPWSAAPPARCETVPAQRSRLSSLPQPACGRRNSTPCCSQRSGRSYSRMHESQAARLGRAERGWVLKEGTVTRAPNDLGAGSGALCP